MRLQMELWDTFWPSNRVFSESALLKMFMIFGFGAKVGVLGASI
jgi:hypothetical protein